MGRASERVKPAVKDTGPGAASARAQEGAMLSWVQAIAPFGIFTTDTELKIRSWNQWLVTHSGLAVEDVLGRPLTEVYPDVAERRMDEPFRRALDGEISVLSTALHKYLLPLRSTLRTNRDAEMLQTARIAPLVYGEETVGTITTIEDVTQRETHALVLRRQQEHDRLLSSALALLLASENPLQVAAQLFPSFVAPLRLEVYFNYLLAPDGSELRLHTAGGVTPEVKKSMEVLRLGEDPCGTCALERRTIYFPDVQGSADPKAQRVRRLGLRTFVGFPLLIGDRLLGTLSFGSYERTTIASDEMEFLLTVAQYLALAIDRAKRENALREAQQSLSEHAEILETKIADRTAKLHETIVQLESFSYTIAHDLRAPIRSLKGFSEILLNDYAAGLPEAAQGMLSRLLRASHRLDALTRDLLEFSRIVRQDVKLSPVDVTELVNEIIVVTPALQDGVLVVSAPSGLVYAQRTLLQQCLTNLFDNALKFARPNVPARIVVRTEGRGNEIPMDAPAATTAFSPSTSQLDSKRFHLGATSSTPWSSHAGAAPRLRIWVEDNGIGIPTHAHQKIFGIFERLSGLDHIEGTGIGLAIVARAMQQMGGTCGVESTAGQGSRFWLELAAANVR